MENKIALALVIFFVWHFDVYSQTTKPQAPVKTGNEWKMPSDVFQRAKTYSSDLQKKLGLDSVQTKRVHDIYLANTKPLDEISVAAVSDKDKTAMRKSNQVAFNEKMKTVLSGLQYQKYIKTLP
ncbi:MAG: hypothetical protein ABJB86_04120 [Bacteroidota bacterium]